MAFVPEDPDALLKRRAFADALTHEGFPTTVSGLATLASRGGGPPFHKYGKYPLYRWGPGLAWAKSRLSKLVTSTSELNVPDERPPLAKPSLGHNGGPPLGGAGGARSNDRPAA